MSLKDRLNTSAVSGGIEVRLGEVSNEAGDVLAIANTYPTCLDLRHDIKEFIALETLATIAETNKSKAINELRSACDRAFMQSKYESLSLEEKQELFVELKNVVFGMGPIEDLLNDEDVTEIMINGSKEVWFERKGMLHKSDISFANDSQVRVLVDKIISPLGRRIDESTPMVNARLSQGQRINAVLPPIAIDGPSVTIRAFSKDTLTLQEYVESDSISANLELPLHWLIEARKNAIVSGGTGTGKTTLLNALGRIIPKEERIVTIEDSAELNLGRNKHVVRLEARPKNSEGVGEITIRDLVINSLRMRPDRIIVGECRGAEALDMLQAMNTGHDGSLTTLHANSPEDSIERLATLVRYAVDLPIDAINAQIGSGVDVVIQLKRDRMGRRYVCELSEIEKRGGQIEVAKRYVRTCFEEVGRWVNVPAYIKSALSYGLIDESEVKLWQSRL